jgi:hypothetical protein
VSHDVLDVPLAEIEGSGIVFDRLPPFALGLEDSATIVKSISVFPQSERPIQIVSGAEQVTLFTTLFTNRLSFVGKLQSSVTSFQMPSSIGA